jgi:hypothetical protein
VSLPACTRCPHPWQNWPSSDPPQLTQTARGGAAACETVRGTATEAPTVEAGESGSATSFMAGEVLRGKVLARRKMRGRRG